jgi:hypothetical protein
MARYLLACGIAVLVTGAAFAAAPQLAIGFSANTITVTGVAPAASVYLYGISRETAGGFVSVVPRNITLRDDDRDGRIDWRLDSDVALRSIWMAVDLTTGAYAAASPDGYPSTRVQLSSDHLKKSFGSDITQLAFGGTLVEFIVARPGTGAWRGMAGLHGPDDEGTDDQKPTLSVLKLKPEDDDSGPAPKNLKKGDVVFVVDSYRAAYGIAQVGEEE